MADVPAFDDIPSFDDLPDAPAQQNAGAVPRFDDIPSFDDLPDSVTAEGQAATFGREAAHGAIPAAAGLVGMGAGALVGAPGGPLGSIAGGIVGGVAASMGANFGQEKILNAAGFNDSEQRRVNAEENKWSAFAGGMAPALVGMSPAAGASKLAPMANQVIQRGAGGAFGGAMEAGQEYLDEGHLDPAKIAVATAAGAVLPGVNKFGAKAVGLGERLVPGRPGRKANPAADQAHEDVGDPVEVTRDASSFAQPESPEPDSTTGNPASAPQRSPRSYPKEEAPPAGGETLTHGDADPATIAALEAANPEPVSAAPQAHAPEPHPEPTPHVEAPAPEAPHVVDAGFPEPSDPVAMGANDVPKNPGAAKAIKRSKEASAEKAMPEIRGETPINDSITEGQQAAGNYPKARTHDFGRPMKIETHAGDTRRGKAADGTEWEVKLPYDYGYFNKTKGADKDHIDFARPTEGDPAHGDKHFIIDQRNAETGKFDEHKVFTYYKDEAATRAQYEAGFSDGKGGERLGAITEVTRPEMVKWLARHQTKAATKPYSKEFGAGEDMKATTEFQKKPAAERAVVKKMAEKFVAKGEPEKAAQLLSAPEDKLAALTAGMRNRDYGVNTGKSAGYPVEGVFTPDGRPVTANTKARAAERSAAHKKVTDWFEKTAPKDIENESNGALLDRLKRDAPNIEAWKPSHKPKEWMLAREAQRVLIKPTPGNIKKFRDAERLLRGGDEAVENYRSGNRQEADQARSHRSGDDAVARAEEVRATHNTVEDDLIASIDAKRKPGFDVPHEEAEAHAPRNPVKTAADLKELPKKTVSAEDSSLAKIDTKAISEEALSAADKRKREAKLLAGKTSKPIGPSEDIKATKGKTINIDNADEAKKLIEKLNAAMKKGDPALEHLPAEHEAPAPKLSKREEDLFTHFMNDQRGELNLNAIKQSWNNMMAHPQMQRTKHASYRAMSLDTPHAKYVQNAADDLRKIVSLDKIQYKKLLDRLSRMPKELNNPATLEAIYHAREADSAHFPLPAGQTGTHMDNLPAATKALYDKYLKPIFLHNDMYFDAGRAIDEKKFGDAVMSHIQRITEGDGAKFHRTGDDATQPTEGFKSLSLSADSAKDRTFYAMVNNATGRRHVISPTDTGFVKWDKYKVERIKDDDFTFKDGDTFTAGPNTYTMRQATTKEIEANALGPDRKPMQYYKNAALSAAMTNLQMGSMVRHMQHLARITNTPEFLERASANPASQQEKGYVKTDFPNLGRPYMHPDLAAVFDDFAGKPQGWYSKLNSAITKLLFWIPIPHINNQGTHGFVSRGWDNANPAAWVRLMGKHLPNAINEVMTQGPYVRAMMREGAGLINPGITTRNMPDQIGKLVNIALKRQPDLWDGIAGKFGLPVRAVHDAVYNKFSAPLMWSTSDVFLVSRVMELEGKGLPMKDAIIEAERDIPPYKLPHVVGMDNAFGRALSKLVSDPRLVAFGRYHYGMINSYANIFKDTFGKNATVADRIDGVGKLAAMGFLMAVVYPYLYDKGAQLITGNDEAKAARRGPTTIPNHLMEAADAKQDPMSALRSVMTVPPLISGGLQLLGNKDFRGKNIVEPGDFSAGAHGDPVRGGKAAVQLGEHVARVAVSPLNTFAGAYQKEQKQGGRPPAATAAIAAGKAVRDMATDIKDPSDAAIKYGRMAKIYAERDARTRERKGGAGPVEGAYNWATKR